jgi:hypothetical protein
MTTPVAPPRTIMSVYWYLLRLKFVLNNPFKFMINDPCLSFQHYKVCYVMAKAEWYSAWQHKLDFILWKCLLRRTYQLCKVGGVLLWLQLLLVCLFYLDWSRSIDFLVLWPEVTGIGAGNIKFLHHLEVWIFIDDINFMAGCWSWMKSSSWFHCICLDF